MNPRQPANQLFYGQMYADDYADRNLAKIGSVNPQTREKMKMWHGRYLSGLGGEDLTGAVGYDPRYQGKHIYDLEKQDDVYGSGIFDPKGRSGTANPDMGILATHNSLPGYIAREVPFTVSRDITDITDDADVVMVPGGGMAYIESRGKLAGPAVLGPTYRPPQIEPGGRTKHDQVYAYLGQPGQEGTVHHPDAPVVPPPTYRPQRTFDEPVRDVPSSPRGIFDVPFETPSRRVPMQEQVTPFMPTAPIAPQKYPVAAAAPDLPAMPGPPFRSTVNVGPTRSVPLGVFGQEDKKEPATPLQLAFAGVLVGAAAGLLISVVR